MPVEHVGGIMILLIFGNALGGRSAACLLGLRGLTGSSSIPYLLRAMGLRRMRDHELPIEVARPQIVLLPLEDLNNC